MNKYVDTVSHLKKKLEKGVGYEKTLHILHKLQKIPITIELLHTTGIGKTVRNLSKQNADKDIGKTAKLLCMTWKAIVKEQQELEEQEEDNYQKPIVKEEPNFVDSYDSKSNSSYDRSEHKIKREYNPSDDEELNQSVVKSESNFYSNSDKRRVNSEDSKSDKRHKKHKSNHKSKESESTVSSKTEFETLLGLNDEIIRNKKSPNKKSETERHNKKWSEYQNNSSVKTETIESNETKYIPNGILDDLDLKTSTKSLNHSDIVSSLSPHTFHYKPLPNRETIEDRIEANRKKLLKNNEELSISIQSKKGRTAVFAGHARTKTYTHVQSLEQSCIQVLQDHYEKLTYLGDVPYYLIKTVLQKCNPKQLSRIEKYNSQIMDETDELWQHFCIKEFRGKEPDEDEDETWRELYFRCCKEREDRLKNITKNISHKQAKALPVRQTQFSENVKTPREILRKQERSGISQSLGLKSGFSGSSSSNHVKIVAEKPKVAPLMKKALKLQKARYRR